MGYGYSYEDYVDIEPFVEDSMDIFGSTALGLGGFVAVFVMLFYLLMITYGIVCYVLQAVGMHAIAKRRGIRSPWLSWLPIGNLWILGSISDQYNYVAKGKVRNRRKVLLGLSIAGFCTAISVTVFGIAGAIGAAGFADGGMGGEALVGATVGIMLLAYAAMAILGIISMVFQFIALYDVYASCNPDNAVIFLLLSIFLNIAPFFIFFSRNKDLGMPPKKQPVIETFAEPVAEPEIVPFSADTPEETE